MRRWALAALLPIVACAGPVRAQDAAHVALRADCPEALPLDLAPALALELDEPVVAGTSAGLIVHVTTPCALAGHEIELWIERDESAALGPVRLEVAELGAGIRGRVIALWIAEHVRIARGVPDPWHAPAADPAPTGESPEVPLERDVVRSAELAASLAAPTPVAPEHTVLGHVLIRGSLAFALGHDLLAGAVGPGADVRIDIGTRGRPGLALDLGLGGTGLIAANGDTWTELRASLGGFLDVMLDARWGSTFGVRLLFVHEVYTGPAGGPDPLPDYRVDDGLDVRGAVFAGGRLYVHGALSIFAEVELGFPLFSFLPGDYAFMRPQNGLQGVLRVGASFG